MTASQDQGPLRGRIAARIREASEALEDAQARQLPAPVVLAIARRAFATAGLASIWLDADAPARDAFVVDSDLETPNVSEMINARSAVFSTQVDTTTPDAVLTPPPTRSTRTAPQPFDA